MKTKKRVINWNKLWKEYDKWLDHKDMFLWKNIHIRLRHKVEKLVEKELEEE